MFKISPTGVLTSLYSFIGGNDGATPMAGLVLGSDGSLYGTTFSGGNTNDFNIVGRAGTVFRISTDGVLTTLYAFGSIPQGYQALDGAGPASTLVQGNDGSFYGTTYGRGTNDAGTIFRLTIVPEPQLTITPSGSYVILTWPRDYKGFSCVGYTLQSTTDLLPPAVWTINSLRPVVVGGQSGLRRTPWPE